MQHIKVKSKHIITKLKYSGWKVYIHGSCGGVNGLYSSALYLKRDVGFQKMTIEGTLSS